MRSGPTTATNVVLANTEGTQPPCNSLAKLDHESSLRLSILRFPLIVCVVFIHAYGSTVDIAGGSLGLNQVSFINEFVRNLISKSIAYAAVPLFFLMSGYLFFIGFEWSREKYGAKVRGRIKTLLIPLIFWNTLMLLVVALGQAMPITKAYFSGNSPPISTFGIYDFLNAIIGIDRYPIAYQFWFIRDLMVLVLLAPVIYILIKKLPLPFLAIVLACWVFNAWPLGGIPASQALLFFSLGSFLALKGNGIFVFDKFGPALTLLYFPVVVLSALNYNEPFNLYFHKIGIILGVLVALFVTSFVVKHEKSKSLLLWLSGTSFFVFAAHEPLMTIFRKVSYVALKPESSSLVLTLYFVLPILVILVAISIYYVLSKFAPRFTGLITGGR